jgi:hypothetical protein
MKLTRAQELYLINIGFKAMMDKLIPSEVRNHRKQKTEIKVKEGMSEASKLQISKRMKTYWRKRRKLEKAAQ